MVSSIIMAYDGEKFDETVKQALGFAEEVVILKISEEGYTIVKQGEGSVLAASFLLKGYGELINECMEYISGEYAVFLRAGESINLENNTLKLVEGCEAYYANVFENRYEGKVKSRQVRVFIKGKCLKGRYQLEDIEGAGSSGLCITGAYDNEKEFIKQWIIKESEDYGMSLDWRDEYILAECYYLLGQYNDACSTYKKIYESGEIEPSALLYRDISWAFIAGERFGEGKAAVEEAISLYPDNRELYYIGAVICKELGDDKGCIYCLERLWKVKWREELRELSDYQGIRSWRIMAEALYSIEEYRKAADYYKLCALEKQEEGQLTLRVCRSLYLSGCSHEEIGEYLKKNLSMTKKLVDETMVDFYRHMEMWSRVGEYAGILEGEECNKAAADSLFHSKGYARCLSEISSSALMKDEHYSMMGICCILLDSSMSREAIRSFIISLKGLGYTELLHMYEYFSGTRRQICSESLLEKFSQLLLETGDSRCIKYVRQALDNKACMDHMRLINAAYSGRLYYFCEEIINVYYSEERYEYEVLQILAYIYYYTGRLSECEKYICYALIIKKSTELIKLGCMCKLKECRELISSYDNSMEAASIKRLSNTITDYEKILLLH